MKAKKLYKYPVTYKDKEYTVTLKYKSEEIVNCCGGYSSPGYYIVKIYSGEKKWYSRCLFKRDVFTQKLIMRYDKELKKSVPSTHILTYQEIVEKTFKYYQKEIDKEEQENKELKDFEEWNGEIKC